MQDRDMDRQKKTAPPPKKRSIKKDPLWERILIAFFGFLLGMDEAFKAEAIRVARFWLGLLAAVPALFSSGKKKKKKKKDAAAKKRAKADKKQRKESKKQRKESEKQEKLLRKQDGKAGKEEKKQEAFQRKLEKKRARRARRRYVVSKIPLLLVLSVLVFEVSVFAGFGVLYFVKNTLSNSPSLTMSIVLGKNGTVSTTVPGSCAYESSGARPCFDLTFFAKNLGLLAFGDEKNMLYTLPNGQKLYVSDGSNTVYIDDVPVSLQCAVRFSGEKVYISTELLTDYTEGVGVNYDGGAKKLTLLCRSADGGAIRFLPVSITEARHPEFV